MSQPDKQMRSGKTLPGRSLSSPLSILLSLLLIEGGAPALRTDTATVRGDLQHADVDDGAGVPNLSNVKWKFRTEGKIDSSPAVAQRKVFFASADGNLYTVDAESGKLSWRLKTRGRLTSSPTVPGWGILEVAIGISTRWIAPRGL